MSTKKTNKSKGLERYVGQEVVLFLKSARFAILDPETGTITKGKEVPGFVVELDEEYLHLGQDKETVYATFPLSEIGAIVLNVQTIPQHLLEMGPSTEDMN